MGRSTIDQTSEEAEADISMDSVKMPTQLKSHQEPNNAVMGIRDDDSRKVIVEQASQVETLLVASGTIPTIVGDSPFNPQASSPTYEESGAKVKVSVDWRDDSVQGQTSIERINASTFEFHCQLEFSQAQSITHIKWPVKAKLSFANLLDNRYHWQTLGSKSRMIDAWTPFVIQGGSTKCCVQIAALERLPANQAKLSNGVLEWAAWLDHEATHPRFTFVGPRERNWHNEYQYRAGDRIDFSFRTMVTDEPAPVLVPGRYPGRKRGLICITDHADHDTCERFAALMFGSSHPDEYRKEGTREGFAGLNLPFTKSVFSQTNDADGAGLHNPRFVELCDHAHECGIELGPHGVHKTRDPDPREYASLMRPFEKYEARTWIDHGRSFQCNYGRSGWDPTHTHNLHQMLDQLHLRFLWGRLDFGQAVPNRVLDQLAIDQFSGWNYLRDLPRSAWRALRSGRPWAFVHELATLLFQLIPDEAIGQYFRMQGSIQSVLWRGKLSGVPAAIREAIKLAIQIVTPRNLRQIARQAVRAREELRFAPMCFREHSSRHRAPARWLFNTVAVHDVEDAFDKASVNRLLNDYGVHLSHTYLASVSRAHLSHAVQRHPKDRNHWQLTPRFADNLKNMAVEKDAGRLWVASFGEVGSFWEQLAEVRIVPESPGLWRIERGQLSQTPIEIEPIAIDLPLVALDDIEHESIMVRKGPDDSRSTKLERLNSEASLGSVELRDNLPLAIEIAARS